ncbi:DUF6170 family protein [Thalassotalea sp. G2M2-11]|uniref:DUF6170 family protein n=1 Tax=Thalassotalea sp. G2M2-11 TaxID=2787627 RepID=UPI0019CF9971|nr:DUF6170 family protein [Thalassotalea sp. G2M2-11]
MTIYFSSKNIPELANLSIKERQEVIAKAQQKFTAPEKLILNLLKLIMLVPPFLFLARQEWTNLAAATVIMLLVHYFINKPLQYLICRKYIK